MMQFVSSYTNDPYMSVRNIINKYGENIPNVTEIPTLAQYGLSEDIEITLKELEDKYTKKVKYIQLVIFIITMTGAFLYGFIKYGTIESGFGLIFTVLIPYGIIYAIFLDGKFKYKKNTELHKRYFEYKKQLDLYNFWNQMKRIDYWMNLDGHEFEEAVASVYRNLGYKAEVSKQGGDGGIDIILTKENKRIAVQCKAHKKPVGPAVARDLFGTMNHYGYEEGILVSRNGFTVGVYEFVKDKPIKLVNLNDILDMTQ